MKDLTASYCQAEYFIDTISKPILIGKTNSAVESLVRNAGATSWCYITGWNPLSVELSNTENTLRNEKLKKELAKFQILEGDGRDKNGESHPERSFLVLGISRRKSKELGRNLGQRAIVFGELGKPAELLETLFTLGNCEIIRENKTAFLCSRKIPASVVLKCYDWAIEQREAGNCVISGFHSTIEKDVLHYLLKGDQPIILILGRGIKKRLEPELKDPIREGRLLVISPFEESVSRVSKYTAQLRNKLMIKLADLVKIGFADSNGMLSRLGVDDNVTIEYIYDDAPSR